MYFSRPPKRRSSRPDTILAFQRSLLLIISLFLLAGCDRNEKPAVTDLTVTDDLGIVLKLTRPAERIVSLAPNITEALFSIGADSLIVGVTDLCDFPPQAKSKRPVGSYISPDFEAIIALKPDLVIMYVTNAQGIAYRSLTGNGIKVFVSNPVDLIGIKKMLLDLGKIASRKLQADSVIRRITEKEEEMRALPQSDSAFIVISVDPLMTAGGKTYISEILKLSGFVNIFGSQTAEYPVINPEQIVSVQPKFIIFPADTADMSKVTGSVDALHRSTSGALRNSVIITIDDDIMFRPGPRVIDAVNALRLRHR